MKLLRRTAWLVLVPGIVAGLVGCSTKPNDSVGPGHMTSLSGDLTHDLTADNSPYVMNGDVTVPVGSSISIDPGVEVYVNGNYAFQVNGQLTAEGAENAFITFTSNHSVPERGDWKGIWLEGAADGTSLRYVHVAYAGKYNLIEDTTRYYDVPGHEGTGIYYTNLKRGAITIHNSSPTIERCIVDQGGYDGIQVTGDSQPIIEFNTITKNAFNAIRLEPDWVAYYDNSGPAVPHATIRNNILVENDDAGIRAPDEQALYEEGLVPDLAYNDVWNNASLDYVPPAFRDRADVTKDIHSNPVFVGIEEGDYHLHPCSGVIDLADPDAAPDPDGTRADIGALPIYQTDFDLSKTLTGDKLHLTGDVYYVQCDVTVEQGDTLTIDPGTQIRFVGPYSLHIRGMLDADGTASAPILFTSDKAEPKRADWRQIVLENASDNSILRNVIIEYGSVENLSKPQPDTLGALSLIGCSPTLQNVTIRESYNTGLFCYSGSSPNVDRLVVDGAGINGIVCDLNSSPTITRAAIRNVQGYGMRISTSSSPSISNVLIYDVDVAGIVIKSFSNPTFDFLTLYGRTSGERPPYNEMHWIAQGVRITNGCRPVFTNSIINEFNTIGVESTVSSVTGLTQVFISSSRTDSTPTSGTFDPVALVEGTDPGFVDPAGGDFQIENGGSAEGQATDGSDLGAYGGTNPL